MGGLKIPECTKDIMENGRNIDSGEIFINPFSGKLRLTRKEALDLMNILTGELLADECSRSKE